MLKIEVTNELTGAQTHLEIKGQPNPASIRLAQRWWRKHKEGPQRLSRSRIKVAMQFSDEWAKEIALLTVGD